jgi:hypothetical protein
VTDPAPPTRPAYLVAPEPDDPYEPEPAPLTRPASVVHPSWGVNVGVPERPVEQPEPQPQPAEPPQPAGATAVRRGAHAAEDEEDDVEPSRVGSTALVTIIAMFCVTLCVAIVSLFGDARGGAVLAGVAIIVGAGMAYFFRERWR